jgi:hypothetical protein
MKTIFFRYALVLLLVQGTVVAQEKLLNQSISISLQDKTLKDVLEFLSSQYGISISYSSDHVPLDKAINLNLKNVSLAEALKVILKNTGITYQEIGNQIVLKKSVESTYSRTSPTQKSNSTKVESSKKETKEELKQEVAFFKEESFALVETKEELRQELVKEQIRIYNDYFNIQDTSGLETGKALKKDLKKALTLLEKKFQQVSDSLELKKKINTVFPTKKEDSLNVQSNSDRISNIVTIESKAANSLISRPGQVTFVYPLGTNGIESPNYSNKISFNVFAGNNGGVDGFELGSLVNIITHDVKGGQIAGLTNVNGGNVKAVQLAGIANVTKKNASGVQTAGITNLVKKSSKGIQVAGIANFAGDTSSTIQAGGIVNYCKGSNIGGQFGGISNFTKGNLVGPQMAGVANIVDGSTKGFQAAGIANFTAKNHIGAQVAGVANFASGVKGIQIASILNTAGKVQGSQIGLINIADSVSGIQVGLLNLSKNGYMKFEVSSTEKLFSSIAFKTGTKDFYGILNVGTGPLNGIDNAWFWWYGYGVGTESKLSNRIPVNLELIANYVSEASKHSHQYFNMLNQIRLTAGYSFSPRFTVFAGPVLNIQVSNMPENVYNDRFDLAPYKMLKHKFERKEADNPTFLSGWVGFCAGVRI